MSPGFFETLGISILRGRDFTYADTEKSAKVAIISAHLERQLFGEGLGLGQRIRVSARPEWQDAEVVGIVSDARVFDVRSNNRAIVYTAAVQSGAWRRTTSAWSRARRHRRHPSCGKAIESLGSRVHAAVADAGVRARPHHPPGAG